MEMHNKAYLLAILAVLLWSTIGSAFKITLEYLNYVQILLLASFVASLFLALQLTFAKKWKSVRNVSLKSIGFSAIMGFLNPFAYYLILLKAYSLLRAQEAVALNYIWPMILVLLSVPFLKQRISWLNIACLAVSFFGTLIIATSGKPFSLDLSSPVGTGLALSSSFFWAVYWLLNLKDTRETDEKLFLNFSFGFLYTFIYCIATSNLVIPDLKGGLGAVYIGLFEMGVTFTIWLNALKFAKNTAVVSNLVYLSPFLSLIIVSFTVGEKIMLSTITGLALIIGGIVIQQFSQSVKSKKL